MSSLIFYIDEQQALVVTDTLVVDSKTNNFKCFSTKAFFVPHINTIVSSTGLSCVFDHWITHINNDFVINDIDDLVSCAQSSMSSVFELYNNQFPGAKDITVTIYCFGFSKKDKKIKAYAHRSTNDFEPEILRYGIGTKPPCEWPTSDHTFCDNIPGIMKRQQEEQKNIPENERIYIGGKILALHLTSDGCNSFQIGELDY